MQSKALHKLHIFLDGLKFPVSISCVNNSVTEFIQLAKSAAIKTKSGSQVHLLLRTTYLKHSISLCEQ